MQIKYMKKILALLIAAAFAFSSCSSFFGDDMKIKSKTEAEEKQNEKPGDEQNGDSQTGDEQTGDNQTGDNQTGNGDNQTGDQNGAENGQTDGNQTASGDNQTDGNQTNDNQTGDNQTGGSTPPASTAPDASADSTVSFTFPTISDITDSISTSSLVVMAGSTVVLTMTDNDDNEYSYQWWLDSEILSGQTSKTYIWNPTAADKGVHTIMCVVQDKNGKTYSSTVTITVKETIQLP